MGVKINHYVCQWHDVSDEKVLLKKLIEAFERLFNTNGHLLPGGHLLFFSNRLSMGSSGNRHDPLA